MEKSTDPFAWAHKLRCPPTICNDSVKKILYTGTVSFLWDDLADLIFTVDEVKTIRKNVLLHQLKTGQPNKVVQCMQNLIQLKSARSDIKNQISKLEEEYEQLDFMVRQKVQKLREIKSERSKIKIRKNLIKMKYDQTVTQIEDCKKMKLVCEYLMPSTCKELDPKLLTEMLNLVSTFWDGANKKQICDTISNNLNIEVPTLWCHLNKNLTQSVDMLMKMVTSKPLDMGIQNLNIGIAKIYGQQISMVTKRLWCNAQADNHQQSILELTEKIEAGSNNSPDIITWLALALEVCKLEIEQKRLGDEVIKIREHLNENSTLAFELAELISEIEDIDKKIMTYAECIQQSLNHLKSLPEHIMKIRNEMSSVLQKILTLRNNFSDYSCLKNSLRTELSMFHDILDCNALRKIKLKNDVGIYRHKSMCITEVSLLVPNNQATHIVHYFPMIHSPTYSLLEYYRNFTLMLFHKRFNSFEIEENLDTLQLSALKHEGYDCNILELLNLSKTINIKTKDEINEFNRILNDWVHHTVEEVMNIVETVVDGATFPEWVERYNLLLYIIQKSK
ncbi:uncharacterized protein LOC117229509 [Megalopta genalis]|uniref:uncharacterized protein LOC117229509 n=1 Tax=Megalopta genalis TaxID=115081 RepID=UPI00144311DD|nr:uncharacterized protein LOC117229509 [Megalopta genalis]